MDLPPAVHQLFSQPIVLLNQAALSRAPWGHVSREAATFINEMGNRSAIELMTGKQPDSAVRLAAYSGVKMKDVVTGHVDVGIVEKYCEDLLDSLEVLHADSRNRADAQRRQHVLRQAKKGPGMRFNPGD